MENSFFPNWNFLFVLFVFLSFVVFILHCTHLCPHVTYSPTTHNTIIHASGQIRTRNPSKRSAAVPRLRRLVHWDRRKSSPGLRTNSANAHPVFSCIYYTCTCACACVSVLSTLLMRSTSVLTQTAKCQTLWRL
jgi:hypothetical protein